MKIGVVKISGQSINDFLFSEQWINSIKKISTEFSGIIFVHGAGSMITGWAKKLGHQSVFHEGHRVTTKELMEVVSAVQGGLLNAKLTARLNSSGIEAVGLSGIDRKTFVAEYLNKSIGFVGNPVLSGSVEWIIQLLENKVIPVFSSICSDKDGNLMNVNADLFAEKLSSSLKADTVYFVSDVSGVILNGTIKDSLNPDEINEGISSGQITDGMIPKLKSCTSLLNNGINKIWIGTDFPSLAEGIKQGTWITTKNKININQSTAA